PPNGPQPRPPPPCPSPKLSPHPRFPWHRAEAEGRRPQTPGTVRRGARPRRELSPERRACGILRAVVPTVLRAVMRGEHLRRCPQWNQPRGHARRSHYATNLVSRLPPRAGAPDGGAEGEPSAEAARGAPPGAHASGHRLGKDIWVPDTSGGKANRLAHQRPQRPATP